MENSVKQYIISSVFNSVSERQVMDNRLKNGFSVGMPVIIHAFIFEKLLEIREYLISHNVTWYVTTDEFPSHDFELPCIRFYDEVPE